MNSKKPDLVPSKRRVPRKKQSQRVSYCDDLHASSQHCSRVGPPPQGPAAAQTFGLQQPIYLIDHLTNFMSDPGGVIVGTRSPHSILQHGPERRRTQGPSLLRLQPLLPIWVGFAPLHAQHPPSFAEKPRFPPISDVLDLPVALAKSVAALIPSPREGQHQLFQFPFYKTPRYQNLQPQRLRPPLISASRGA